MKDFEFYEIVGNPETITEEMFNSFTRSEQLEVLEYRPDLLEFFQKNYPDLTADEEIELIRHGWLDFKDAKNKTQFSGDGILKLIISETISQTEFEQYGCDKKLEPRHWVEVLGYFGVVCKWCEPYCDFSRFSSGNWLSLLLECPEYADRCPFEMFEAEELDHLLRYQPELTAQSGIIDPVKLHLVNLRPYEQDNDGTPFYPAVPKDEHAEKIKLWLRQAFPELSEMSWLHLILHILFEADTLLGVYNREYAEFKLQSIKNLLPSDCGIYFEIEEF